VKHHTRRTGNSFTSGVTGEVEQTLVVRAGQMAVVPMGVEHKPSAPAEVKLLLIEPRGVLNTGDGAQGGRTAQNDVWV